MNMRVVAVAAILILLATVGLGAVIAPRLIAAWFEPTPAAAAPGQLGRFVATPGTPPAPDLAFTDREGRPVRLTDMRGKVVVLNLWATWCAPCVREMPALDRLQALVGGPDAEIVALSLDRGGMAQVGPFFERLGLANLAIYLDPPSEAMKAFRPRGLPTTIIVGRDGRELGRVEGELAWDGEPGQTIVRDARAAGG
jgi:thiol-disulfide isomerase/thioredoxin